MTARKSNHRRILLRTLYRSYEAFFSAVPALTCALLTSFAVALACYPQVSDAQNDVARDDVRRTSVNRIQQVGLNAELSALDDLREKQQRISRVVSSQLETVVAVSDGLGFGSGVVVNETGLVLTAGHVMAGRGPYEVIFPGGRRVTARPVGKNLNIDAGMVQITEPGPWPFANLAESDPEPGDWVIGLGHSGGFEQGRRPPVRTGRYLRKFGFQMVTDAVLIGGDSGGPLFNLDGDVIAIHSSIGDDVAQNRHVLISEFRKHWDRMRRGDSWGELPALTAIEDAVPKPKIGVTVDRNPGNAQVTKVKPGSPAESAGILVGDVIIEFDGTPITDAGHLIREIGRRQPGETATVKVVRNGMALSLSVYLEESR